MPENQEKPQNGSGESYSNTNFPPMKNVNVLTVIKGGVPDTIPIWIMRQAGRYLPEFREFRQKHAFKEICKTPELACEVTLMPIRRYGFDAAIIFSDIMVVPEALGMRLEMTPGPTFPEPITTDNIDCLKPEGAIERLKYVGDAITLTRHKLNGEAVLFGFAGAPWTLMGYMIEGGGSKDYNNAKKWLYLHKAKSHELVSILTNTVADFCVLQARAGAQVIQIFDTNAEKVNKAIYHEFFLRPLAIIRERVKTAMKNEGREEVPMVIYAKGAFHSIADLVRIGYDVISLDWQTEPSFALSVSPDPNICLQGNLDPCALYANKEELQKCVTKMLEKFEGTRFIVNLGHGILPDIPIESVYIFVETVRNFSKESAKALNNNA